MINKIKTKLRDSNNSINDIRRFYLGLYNNRKIIKNWFSLFIKFLENKLLKKMSDKSIQIKAIISPSLIQYFPIADLKRVIDLFSVSIADVCFNHYKKLYGKEFILNKGDVVIDIGAHIGRFCLPTFLKYPNIRMYAFEPDVVNYNCLLRNISENYFDKSNFQVENIAVFNKTGNYNFSIGPESTQGSLSEIGFFLDSSHSNRVTVKTKTLETIFNENHIEKCNLLKIDCEGSEYEIFYDLSKEIFQKIQNIYIEIHPTRDNQPETLKQLLRANGFEIQEFNRRDDGCVEAFCIRKISDIVNK